MNKIDHAILLNDAIDKLKALKDSYVYGALDSTETFEKWLKDSFEVSNDIDRIRSLVTITYHDERLNIKED